MGDSRLVTLTRESSTRPWGAAHSGLALPHILLLGRGVNYDLIHKTSPSVLRNNKALVKPKSTKLRVDYSYLESPIIFDDF
jgi:hypothetical protein